MAKSDSFFIRASVPTNGTTFNQVSVDLGAYVDALGKSVLRIHNIAVQYGAPNDALVPGGTGGIEFALQYQLTTQSQSATVDVTDKSLIASGRLSCVTLTSAPLDTTTPTDFQDVSPQQWTNGFLVGVEQIYLGCEGLGTDVGLQQVAVVMECTVETLSQNAAMALALSQQ